MYTFDGFLHEISSNSGFDLKSERIVRWVGYDINFRSLPELALWLPEIDFPRVCPLPSNIEYIGPRVDVDRKETDLSFERRPNFRYLIYVSMGKAVTFNWKRDLRLIKTIIRAFRNTTEIDVVISTGDERTTSALGGVPSNVRVFSSVPQLAILGLADLAIIHAGAGATRECIMKGVPMLAYPCEFDQLGNSARIVYLGLGLRGKRTRDSARTIRRKALTILKDNRFAGNVRKLRTKIERYEESDDNNFLRRLRSELNANKAPSIRT
jgi:UDP:flavonoid glycosyltransferase YjiC (YdhE family)